MNNEKRSFAKKNLDRRPNTVTFLKSFNSFEEGFSEIIKLNPELKNYCGESPIYENVISSMLDILKMDIPSLNNQSYPNTLSLSVEAKEVGFKTDSNIAIGWRTGYNYKKGIQYFNFRISYINLPSYKKIIFKDMESNGWSKVDPNAAPKQSRFWDRIEGKDSNKPRESTPKTTTPPVVMTEPLPKEEEPDLPPPLFEEAESEEPSLELEYTTEDEPSDEVEENPEPVIEDAEYTEAEDKSSWLDLPKDYPMTKDAAILKLIQSNQYVPGEEIQLTWQDPKTGKNVIITTQDIIKFKMDHDNSINRTMLPTKFVVTHRGVSTVIDINNEETYGEAEVNTYTKEIIFKDGVIYDYEKLTISGL